MPRAHADAGQASSFVSSDLSTSDDTRSSTSAAGAPSPVHTDSTSSRVKVPANTPVTLIVRNLDPTPEEFESNTLRVEKVVAGNSEITFNFRPLAPGRYRFYGDFNEATAQGAITAE